MEINDTAAMEGDCGMEIFISGDSGSWVMDDSPSLEKVYRAKFLYDPNGMSIVKGQSMVIMEGRSDDWQNPGGGTIKAFRVVIKKKGSGYYIRVKAWYNTGKKLSSKPVHIGPTGFAGTKQIEVEWWAGNGDDPIGRCRVRVDGGAWSDVGVKNKLMAIEKVTLGAFLFTSPSTSGSNYFDSFESFRTLAP